VLTLFKGFTECEKMDFKAPPQRVGSFEVLIQVKTLEEDFLIYKDHLASAVGLIGQPKLLFRLSK
jgi:hypothetical protein